MLLISSSLLDGDAWWQTPWLLAVAPYVVVGVVTFFTYGYDKKAARSQRRRVPEARLHLLELLGGWPAGFLAQRVFRHKTRKVSYQIKFWLMGAAHAGAWWWFLR